MIADEIIRGAKRGEERRIGGQFPAGTAAQQIHFPFQLAFRTLARGLHFVADSGGDAFAKGGIQAHEFVLALGANVDFDARFVGNGIYGCAALDLADVKRRSRAGRNFCVDEAHGTSDESVDRIGHAEIRPTVAARTGDKRFEAARSQRSRGDLLRAGTVENHNGLKFRAIGIDEGTHAPEIAFPFLTNVSDEKNGSLRLQVRGLHSACQRQERRQACAIVGNARRAHARAFAMNLHVRAGGKNGIEVRRDDDDFLFVCAP